MAHYAFLNNNSVVIEVIGGVDEDSTDTLPEGFSSWEEWYGNFRNKTCKRTSYNTRANTHIDGGTPFRGNYAGIGDTYDADNDVFYAPQPFSSWTLNESTWVWEAPITKPDDGNSYLWDEDAYQADTADPKTEGWVQITS